jgi:sigma-B regulation protein RsbU (phosphoserine phosphatase)
LTISLHPDEQRATLFRKLTEVSRALTYAVSLEDVLRLTVDRAAELLATDKAVLMLTNSDGLLSVQAAFGLDRALTERFREPLDETLIGRLEGLLGVDAGRFLSVPLVVAGAVTGILAVTVQQDTDPSEQEWLLSALADQAAVALEKTRLDQAAQFRDRLIGIVSHDLRNPIGAMLMSANVLLRRDELDERTIKVAARIKSSGERAIRLIRDLLDYTQAHLGPGIPIERRPADLHVIVGQVVDEMQAAHPERRIEVRREGDGRGDWDVDRLAQVVENLLSNALKYSPPDTPVTVELTGDAASVQLVIHNHGESIPSERLPHIFEPMQRGVDDASDAGRSVGLGLYVVKHLVDAHQGRVTVASSTTAGTSFTVSLPRR